VFFHSSLQEVAASLRHTLASGWLFRPLLASSLAGCCFFFAPAHPTINRSPLVIGCFVFFCLMMLLSQYHRDVTDHDRIKHVWQHWRAFVRISWLASARKKSIVDRLVPRAK